MVNRSRSFRSPSNAKAAKLKRNFSFDHRPITSNGAKRKFLLPLLILILLGTGAYLLFSQTEEKKIKKLFHQLSKAISKESGETIFTMDQKIKTIRSLLDEDCEIYIPAYSITGRLSREEIAAYAARSKLHLSELHLTFYDFRITFPQTDQGKVHMTARLTGRMTTGETLNEAHEIDCLLKKIEKRWLLAKIEVVEVLKR